MSFNVMTPHHTKCIKIAQKVLKSLNFARLKEDITLKTKLLVNKLRIYILRDLISVISFS